jgi:hypothetical protein
MTESTKTVTELIREAADRLQIVGTGQPLEPEYAERIEVNVDPLLMQLAADGICQVANKNYIPGEWFDSLAGLLANMCAAVAGKQYAPEIKAFYELQLRRIMAASPSFTVLESEYF